MVIVSAQQESEPFIDDRAAAKHLSVSAAYLRKLPRTGKGPKFYRIGGKLIRYRISDLDAWIK